MIDIGDLYDAPLAVESSRTNSRLVRAEQQGDERDSGQKSLPSHVQSLDAYLTSLRLTAFASPAEDDDLENDDTRLVATADSDELQVGFDEAMRIIDSGMIEMSHEDAGSPRTPPAGSPARASAETDRCPVEHGSYVKTDGGAARYQAIEIGINALEALIVANDEK